MRIYIDKERLQLVSGPNGGDIGTTSTPLVFPRTKTPLEFQFLAASADGTTQVPVLLPVDTVFGLGFKLVGKFEGDVIVALDPDAVTRPAVGTGTGYLINHTDGYTLNDTALTLDTGTGSILAGDIITIRSYSYTVAAALAANVVTIESPGLLEAVPDNAAVTITSSTGFYTTSLNCDTDEVRAILLTPDGNEDNDVDSVALASNFTFKLPTDDPLDPPTMTQRVYARVDNVYAGDGDAIPASATPHSYVLVAQGSTAIFSGDNLRAAYVRAAALLPGGAALSATNRACVLVPPGRYDFVTTPLGMDADFVDLVGLTGNPRDVIITSQVTASASGTIVQTADDVHISGVTIQNTASTRLANDATDAAAYAPQGGGSAGSIIEDCIFDDNGGTSWGMSLAGYAGTYRRCIAPDFAFGYGTGGGFVGLAEDCTVGHYSFGSYSGSAFAGVARRCRAGDYSFGWLTLCLGEAEDCTAGASSFGAGDTFSGVATRCTAGVDSFGGGSGVLIGKLYYCRLTSGSFQTVSDAGLTRYCLDGSDVANNQG